MKLSKLFLVIALVMILSLTGCSTGGALITDDPYESQSATDPEPPTTDPEPITDPKSTTDPEPTQTPTAPSPDYSKITIVSASDSALQKIADADQVIHVAKEHKNLALDGTDIQQIESIIMADCIYADAVARAICDVKLYSGRTIGDLNPWLTEFISCNNATLDDPENGWTIYMEWRDAEHTSIYLNSLYYDYIAKLITLLENLSCRTVSCKDFGDSLDFYKIKGEEAAFYRGELDTYGADLNHNGLAFELYDGVWNQSIFVINESCAFVGKISMPARWSNDGDYYVAHYDVPIGDGYSVRYTVSYSAWINTKNTNTLKSAWSHFSNGVGSLPSAEPSYWGLSRDASGNYRTKFEGSGSVHNATVKVKGGITDSYFLIGNVSVQNITPGWNFSADNSRTADIELRIEEYSSSKFFTTLGEIYLGNKSTMMDGCAYCYPIMKNNKWGPVPFVLVQFDAASPDYPDGRYASTRELPLKLNGYGLAVPN